MTTAALYAETRQQIALLAADTRRHRYRELLAESDRLVDDLELGNLAGRWEPLPAEVEAVTRLAVRIGCSVPLEVGNLPALLEAVFNLQAPLLRAVRRIDVPPEDDGDQPPEPLSPERREALLAAAHRGGQARREMAQRKRASAEQRRAWASVLRWLEQEPAGAETLPIGFVSLLLLADSNLAAMVRAGVVERGRDWRYRAVAGWRKRLGEGGL